MNSSIVQSFAISPRFFSFFFFFSGDRFVKQTKHWCWCVICFFLFVWMGHHQRRLWRSIDRSSSDSKDRHEIKDQISNDPLSFFVALSLQHSLTRKNARSPHHHHHNRHQPHLAKTTARRPRRNKYFTQYNRGLAIHQRSSVQSSIEKGFGIWWFSNLFGRK